MATLQEAFDEGFQSVKAYLDAMGAEHVARFQAIEARLAAVEAAPDRRLAPRVRPIPQPQEADHAA